MKWKHPKALLALTSLAAVLVVVYLDLERASPGALARVHAEDERLAGSAGCEACHGELGLARSCTSCHVEIGAQVEDGRGFHGQLAAEQRTACGACHAEHHGADQALVSDGAFALAGFASVASYDHRGLGLVLEGRHAELECADCHPHAKAEALARGEKRFLGLDARCERCHDDPHQGRMVRDCELCHGERGAFRELTAFVHTREFPLSGGHAGRACTECHDGDRSVEAEAGEAPPPARRCGDCHESPHAPRFVAEVAALVDANPSASCVQCHAADAASFADAGAEMPRALHAASGFALDAPHDVQDCVACHAPSGEFAARYPGRAANDCAACHEDPHGGQFARVAGDVRSRDKSSTVGESRRPSEMPSPAVEDLSRLRTSPACLDCHSPHAFDPPRFGTSEHALTAFPLEASHLQAACHDCHRVPDDHAGAPRVFRGTPSACASCHADAHAGFFERRSGLALASDCATCHAPTRFAELERARFDHAQWTGFALDGAHARADCERCHAPSKEPDALGRRFGRAVAAFGGAFEDCASCHADAHAGAFDARDLPALVEGERGCARCHASEDFRTLARPFDHAQWTGFALEGAHANANCERCHAPSKEPDALGRRFGRAAHPFGPLERGCASCHADPHGGRFDVASAPKSVDGRTSCARCHDTSSFRTADERFDHAQWTGFALEGAHAAQDCASCHPASRRPGERELGRARGSACADCHADPHAGQFGERGAPVDCARCHQSASSFAELAFDHARDSRFALDAKHAQLACSACHQPWPLASGEKIVRYKPLGTQCADCHGPGGGR